MERALEGIREKHVARLQERGYAIIDGFLPEAVAVGVLNEVQTLQQTDQLSPNEIGFREQKHIRVTKPHIYEADLHQHELRARMEHLDRLFNESHLLAARWNALYPALKLGTQQGQHTLKVQYNAGHGACFPWHYDNPGPPDRRRLSCLLYLNPDWEPSHGGSILVSPFLQPSTRVSPLFNRLVVFYAESMLHRVEPAHQERYCLTFWLDSDDANQSHLGWPGMEEYVSTDALLRQLNSSSIHRALSRAVYEDEYEASIRACMRENTVGEEALVSSHRQRVEQMMQSPNGPLIERLRMMRIPLL